MQIKLIIWDLDDTLWRGTLADGDAVVLDEGRAALVRAFNERGVISSICSKNDEAAARARLEALGLWDQFVFPRIAFAPKPEAIREIIATAQLRPANILFVDDNRHNLEAVRYALPDIHLLDAAAPDADAILEALLAAQPQGARSRLAEYRMLEARAQDRAASAGSDEAFLRQCAIGACAPYLMDNLDFVARIAELVNRSNQLNYTASRVEPAALAETIIDVVRHDSWSIFAWDRYGEHGLVGFVQVDRQARRLIHFTFSCRVMHMGLERYALGKIFAKWPDCDISVLDGRVERGAADWIADCSFDEPAVRERLIAALNPQAAGARDIRIMADCQSGGLAHFSRLRGRIDFDNAPRVFSLRHVVTGEAPEAPFAPTLVYGAGVDYSDPRWPDLADLLESAGLFEACVHLFCERVGEDGAHMLVILPPEDAPEGHYRPHMGHTRARTIAFNAIWREAAALHDRIDLLELTGLARPEHMPDVSHYYASFLQTLATAVDDWVEGKALPAAAAA